MASLFYFLLPRLQEDISGTNDPIERVHLSMSAEMNKECNETVMKRLFKQLFC